MQLSLNRSADLYGNSTERHSNFRSESPAHLSLGAPAALAPQTGLSVLMSRGASPSAPISHATALGTMTSASLEEQRKIKEDLVDRERQASALAAAGMVAESVRLAQPIPTTSANVGLPHPGQLVTSTLAPIHATEVDSINWNMMDVGSPRLDDLDLDFAALFDPIHEIERMRSEGSGWPPTAGTGVSPAEAGMPPKNGASSNPTTHHTSSS